MPANGLTSLLWFIAILLLIPLALWLLKRSPAGARFTGVAATGALRHIAALPISASQRVVTIEVGQGEDRRWLVLGVTPQAITTLHTMAPQAEAPTAAMPAMPPFAQMLMRLRQGKGTGHDA
jgi:flagellar protein FliO/FliZ